MSTEADDEALDASERLAILSRFQAGAAPRPAVEHGFQPAAGTALDSDVLGNRLLRRLERGFLHMDRLLGRILPESLNPFLHTGAVTAASFIVAIVTGVLLLFWYRPSLLMAYDSVAAMSTSPWTAGLMRSLHRYSSDLCMFFALVHALRLFLMRRFGGARWLAWVTGVAMLGALWFIGWTGYWLVWDERAQQVAVGTARVLDALPIFADPMGRSFLTDQGVNSLLFFVVFFVHMLVPLAFGVLLLLHITRAARPRFLTSAPLTVWVLGSLLLLCVAYPATSAEPAQMTVPPLAFSMDWWYLLPIALTDRLGGGVLWSLLILGGLVPLAVPWWMTRGRPKPAHVEPRLCNACLRCYEDCPYLAISMIPRTDGSRRYTIQADIDPAKCVGCGICAGSCDTAAIGLDWFAVGDQRSRFARWLKQAIEAREAAHVAFVCAESAGAGLSIDPETGRCAELPGYLALEVPCGGWLHPFGVEHAMRYGGKGALVVTCGPGECRYREGAAWEWMRMDGEREPMLRADKVAREHVLMLSLDRTRKGDLVRRARAFREGRPLPPESAPGRTLSGVAAAVLAALVAAGLGVVSDLGYAAPRIEGSELVVTFKHPGRIAEACRELSEAEKAHRPVHMRQEQICARRRSPVRLRVSLDGKAVLEQAYPPGGVWGDQNSVAVEHIAVAPGDHQLIVAIGDSADPEEWSYTVEETTAFDEGARRVLSFDRLAGFELH